MLVRIVKMQFAPGKVEDFQSIFDQVKDKIRASEGCIGVNLLQDADDPHIFFTYSRWIDRSALENYRSSDFFRSTWSKTRALFSQKAEAWSLYQTA